MATSLNKNQEEDNETTLNSQLQMVAPQTNSNLPRKGTEERVARQISVSERTLLMKKISQKRVKKFGYSPRFISWKVEKFLNAKTCVHALTNQHPEASPGEEDKINAKSAKIFSSVLNCSLLVMFSTQLPILTKFTSNVSLRASISQTSLLLS